MSQIVINDCVYTITKTYEAALGIVLCFIEPEMAGMQHVMMLTPDGDWKFTGSKSDHLKNEEDSISDAIHKLSEQLPLCYS